jgi:methylated-DNA-protein-cysteine methyltransferase-like protein
LTGVFSRILAVVRRIPHGRVATYGQVAALAGLPRHARHVGYALHGLPAGTPLPWHRVLNARGGISLRPWDGGADTQRLRLAAEGVRFDARGRVPLDRYGWRPAGRPRPASRRLARSRRLG